MSIILASILLLASPNIGALSPLPNPANFDFECRVFSPGGDSFKVTGRYRLKSGIDGYWDSMLEINSDEKWPPSTKENLTVRNPKAFTSFHSSLKTTEKVYTWWITMPIDRIERNFPILLLEHTNDTKVKTYSLSGLCDFGNVEVAR